MNYAEELREKINSNEPKSVNAIIYARVSTDNDGQKDSCSNQVDLAMAYIKKNPSINLVNTYVDDGISGKNDFTRPEYNKMLQDISTGNIDLIITKALSRLNRDEMNSFQLKQLLLQTNTTVLTLEDNQIHDFEDINSGLLHSIHFAMDAQFVLRQSINGRKTHELRCQRKELSAKDISYGYDWNKNDKSITINEDQAEIVRKIFHNYVYQNGTPASIHRDLEAEGVKISSRSLVNMIKDERYIGNFYINKRTTILGTGKTKSKRVMLPKDEWVLVERPDLQIIDNDLFDMAQRINESRKKNYDAPDKNAVQARFQGVHTFAGKIFCPVCGKPYRFGHADRNKTIPYYYIQSHGDCSNPVRRIYEEDLEAVTRIALKQILEQTEDLYSSLESILIESVKASQNCDNEIEKLNKQIKSREKQLDSLIETLSEGGLIDAAKERIIQKMNKLTSEIEDFNNKIADKESSRLNDSYVTDKIKEIKEAIAELKEFTVIDRDRVQNYIERIELPANGDINITLKTGQFITVRRTEYEVSKDLDSVSKKGIQDDLCSLPEAYPGFHHLLPRPQ